ncbi:MAG TPA: nickel-dependent hydrogenase large subunit [Streptosporangiaceae bacterium]|nr:nickel-dependent hydrogenase large subunit [Streptosporangiaceae bacterium]
MPRTVIDPITRIEGHMRVEVEHTDHVVRDAWSTGTMFRGIELILDGRDPREAWVIAQRACGVCTHVHAISSVRAMEDALGIVIPPNARIVRNLLSGSQFVHDHVIHFYHLHALDWVDVMAALSADPAATAELCSRTNVGWPKNSAAYFGEVRARLQGFVDSGQLGPFGGGYWGHPAYTLSPEADLLLVAHYLEALEWQRDFIRVHAILGGKNPHPQTYAVGGMAITLAPDAPSGVNNATLTQMDDLLTAGREFVDKVLVPDVALVASHYKDQWAALGAGPGNLLSYGDFPEGDTGADSFFLPRGRIVGRDLGAALPVDQAAIAETVAHSWYSYTDGDETLKHPSVGETRPRYTGPRPPYESITSIKYSWLKAPRYEGAVYEVGPLARLAVAYAAGVEEAREATDRFLNRADLRATDLFSTLGRVAARAVETQLLAARLPVWLRSLRDNMARGDLRVSDNTKWDPATWPAAATGWGATEAPRGSLGHWVSIADGKIAAYQLVVPTTWNGSPRDAAGRRGAWEQALLTTPLADPERPVEVLRTLHSFDPCMACAVHVHDPASGASVTVRIG